MNMPNARLSIRLESELKDWLEAEAKRQDRSAGYAVNQAIKSLKYANEQKHKIISEAMELADAGEFVSEENMDGWVHSWEGNKDAALPVPDVFPHEK